MSQWNLVIDVARCENCNNCVLANKDEYVGNDFPGYSSPHELHGPGTIRIERHVRGESHLVDSAYLPTMCNHCDNAPCMKVGGDAIKKRADGIVIIDPVKSKGRKDIVSSCPYGAIVWNEELQIPQQWTFDAHLLDSGWKEPRCSQTCPTDSMKAFKVSKSEMDKMVKEENLTVLKPELGTLPRVYYKNMYRFTHSFIGGSVVAKIEGRLECVNGANVDLYQNGKLIQLTKTDCFGDFKFDELLPDSGSYQVIASHKELGTVSMEVNLGSTQVLGDLELVRS